MNMRSSYILLFIAVLLCTTQAQETCVYRQRLYDMMQRVKEKINCCKNLALNSVSNMKQTATGYKDSALNSMSNVKHKVMDKGKRAYDRLMEKIQIARKKSEIKKDEVVDHSKDLQQLLDALNMMQSRFRSETMNRELEDKDEASESKEEKDKKIKEEL